MNIAVKQRFEQYPKNARVRLEQLRGLVLKVASELELGEVVESLKWGEPSYSVKSGSPVRMDWKQNSPNNYYLFFHCQTKLVATFRELYGQVLEFEGNRAIVFQLSEPLPESIIEQCLKLALTYKKCKHLPLLGA